jgi:hypothetical protein
MRKARHRSGAIKHCLHFDRIAFLALVLLQKDYEGSILPPNIKMQQTALPLLILALGSLKTDET